MDASPGSRSLLPPASHYSPSRPQPTRQPSLLPAFEPISSSPPRVNYQKRKYEETIAPAPKYPTPMPSSSTAIASSSPPRRPGLQRTTSTCSERAPLSSVESVRVPANGETILLGRSSASSHYQLPYNRHISRIHVSAKYEPRSASNASSRLVIECLGWNGCKVHSGGRVHELAKGETFANGEYSSEIMLDVQDSRVIVAWPLIDESEDAWALESSPEAQLGPPVSFRSSPPAILPQSPVSPSPARPPLTNISAALYGDENLDPEGQGAVQVYEDPESDNGQEPDPQSPSVSMQTTFHQSFSAKKAAQRVSEETNLSSLSEEFEEREHENEENDPIIHSFGPFGSNILSRMNSFSANDPHQSPTHPAKRRKVLKESSESPQRHPSLATAFQVAPEPRPHLHISPIKNHVINQLAFSRVHAIPLSTIHGALPSDLKTENSSSTNNDEVLTYVDLKQILDNTPCIGEITREGKDAAGKPLENQFYYMPENDDNTMRRDAVLGSMGSTRLRAVRKNHKQYFWKPPRH